MLFCSLAALTLVLVPAASHFVVHPASLLALVEGGMVGVMGRWHTPEPADGVCTALGRS